MPDRALPRLRYVLPFTPLALAVVALDEALGFLLLIAMVGGLTVLFALRLRPSLAHLWPLRPVRLSEPVAVIVGLAMAVVVLGLALAIASAGHQVIELARGRGTFSLEPWLAAPLFALASGPSLLWQWRARPGGTTEEPPLWPCAVSILAVLPLGLVTVIATAVVEGLLSPHQSRWSDLLEAALFLPGLAMIAAPCAALWWRAACADGSVPMETFGLLEAGLESAKIALAAPLSILIWQLVSTLQTAQPIDGGALTLTFGLIYLLVVAGVWLVVFRKLSGLKEDNLFVIVLAVPALALALPISLALPHAVANQSGGWGPLLAFIALPVLAFEVAAIILLGWFIGVITRRSRRFTVEQPPLRGSTG